MNINILSFINKKNAKQSIMQSTNIRILCLPFTSIFILGDISFSIKVASTYLAATIMITEAQVLFK